MHPKDKLHVVYLENIFGVLLDLTASILRIFALMCIEDIGL